MNNVFRLAVCGVFFLAGPPTEAESTGGLVDFTNPLAGAGGSAKN